MWSKILIIEKCKLLCFLFVLIVIECAPVRQIDKHINEILGEEIQAQGIRSVYRYKQIPTWLLKSPVFVYKGYRFPPLYYIIGIENDSSVFFIRQISEYNKLIEKHPYHVDNNSEAIEVVKEYLRITNVVDDEYRLFFLDSISQLPKSTRERMKGELTSFYYCRALLKAPSLSAEKRKYIERKLKYDEARFLKIRKILDKCDGFTTVTQVGNNFEVSLLMCLFAKWNIYLYDITLSVSPLGNLKGTIELIVEEKGFFKYVDKEKIKGSIIEK